ncbi:MAG: Cof-type HAD-IIB family hydrolase [Propionibacteriaceae bacterium]|jgi:Cof subfamily protein (haloacid dehalogenase superfamily)|nr:Cof-type HAD-IIB family hydrolase [Propionibacteriaceae bacterium]
MSQPQDKSGLPTTTLADGRTLANAGTRPYKLVAFDVDGTIADLNTGIIPADVRTAIRRIQSQGVPVVLTTGRAWVAAQEAAGQLGWAQEETDTQSEYFVCSNGAVVAQYPPLDILRLSTFTPGDIIDKVAAIPSVILASEEFGVGYRVTQYFEPGLLRGEQTLVTPEELKDTQCLKLIVHLGPGSEEDLHSYMADIDFGNLIVFRGTNHWYDVCPPDTSKARGLQVVTERLGIDKSEVLAFGDGYNDIEILRWAGRGVALGDAPEEVRAAADAVTPPFHDGGVLPELARWFG